MRSTPAAVFAGLRQCNVRATAAGKLRACLAHRTAARVHGVDGAGRHTLRCAGVGQRADSETLARSPTGGEQLGMEGGEELGEAVHGQKTRPRVGSRNACTSTRTRDDRELFRADFLWFAVAWYGVRSS
eukprot:3493768-Prymnesium_polylepis.1